MDTVVEDPWCRRPCCLHQSKHRFAVVGYPWSQRPCFIHQSTHGCGGVYSMMSTPLFYAPMGLASGGGLPFVQPHCFIHQSTHCLWQWTGCGVSAPVLFTNGHTVGRGGLSMVNAPVFYTPINTSQAVGLSIVPAHVARANAKGLNIVFHSIASINGSFSNTVYIWHLLKAPEFVEIDLTLSS